MLVTCLAVLFGYFVVGYLSLPVCLVWLLLNLLVGCLVVFVFCFWELIV